MVNKVNKLITIITLVGAGVVGVNSAETLTTNVYAENIYDINLAAPDLDGKEHLYEEYYHAPNGYEYYGLYRLYWDNGVEITYNVFSGIWTIWGTTTKSFGYNMFNVEQNTKYTLSYISVAGTLSGSVYFNVYEPLYDVIYQKNENVNKQDTFLTTTQDKFRLWYC